MKINLESIRLSDRNIVEPISPAHSHGSAAQLTRPDSQAETRVTRSIAAAPAFATDRLGQSRSKVEAIDHLSGLPNELFAAVTSALHTNRNADSTRDMLALAATSKTNRLRVAPTARQYETARFQWFVRAIPATFDRADLDFEFHFLDDLALRADMLTRAQCSQIIAEVINLDDFPRPTPDLTAADNDLQNPEVQEFVQSIQGRCLRALGPLIDFASGAERTLILNHAIALNRYLPALIREWTQLRVPFTPQERATLSAALDRSSIKDLAKLLPLPDDTVDATEMLSEAQLRHIADALHTSAAPGPGLDHSPYRHEQTIKRCLLLAGLSRFSAVEQKVIVDRAFTVTPENEHAELLRATHLNFAQTNSATQAVLHGHIDRLLRGAVLDSRACRNLGTLLPHFFDSQINDYAPHVLQQSMNDFFALGSYEKVVARVMPHIARFTSDFRTAFAKKHLASDEYDLSLVDPNLLIEKLDQFSTADIEMLAKRICDRAKRGSIFDTQGVADLCKHFPLRSKNTQDEIYETRLAIDAQDSPRGRPWGLEYAYPHLDTLQQQRLLDRLRETAPATDQNTDLECATAQMMGKILPHLPPDERKVWLERFYRHPANSYLIAAVRPAIDKLSTVEQRQYWHEAKRITEVEPMLKLFTQAPVKLLLS